MNPSPSIVPPSCSIPYTHVHTAPPTPAPPKKQAETWKNIRLKFVFLFTEDTNGFVTEKDNYNNKTTSM